MIIEFIWPEIKNIDDAEDVAMRSVIAALAMTIPSIIQIALSTINLSDKYLSQLENTHLEQILAQIIFISILGILTCFVVKNKNIICASLIFIMSLLSLFMGTLYVVWLSAVILSIAGTRGCIEFHKIKNRSQP